MKMITADLLDKVFYLDRENTDPLKMNPTPEQRKIAEETKTQPITNDATYRDYLKIIIDQPTPQKPLTLDKARHLEACYKRLNGGGDFIVEVNEFEALKSHTITEIGINKQTVLMSLNCLFESAKDYEAPKVQPASEDNKTP